MQFEFGDVFERKNGITYKVVFLGRDKKGFFFFGSEGGGRLYLSLQEVEQDVADGNLKLIAKMQKI